MHEEQGFGRTRQCRLTSVVPPTPTLVPHAARVLQALHGRIVYPSAFNRAYRCVVKYIKSYVMEELANLIFIGCYIAQCGPPGFKSLWMRLQPAVWHYLYGRDDTAAQRRAAAVSLQNYASRLEKYVIDGKVPYCTLFKCHACHTCSPACMCPSEY